MFRQIFFKTALSLLVSALFLCGCSMNRPDSLGLSDSEWDNYSATQQEQLLQNYEQYSKESAGRFHKKLAAPTGLYLKVHIHDGEIMMPPFDKWQSYKPIDFIIAQNSCAKLPIAKTQLGVCYQDNVLYLDPSHYDLSKKNGSININYSPLWQSGFSYSEISSTGYVRLNKVTIDIKQEDASSH